MDDLDDLEDLDAIECANRAVLPALGGACMVAVWVWLDIVGVEVMGVDRSPSESFEVSSESS